MVKFFDRRLRNIHCVAMEKIISRVILVLDIEKICHSNNLKVTFKIIDMTDVYDDSR